jgi:hypothetical protein
VEQRRQQVEAVAVSLDDLRAGLPAGRRMPPG